MKSILRTRKGECFLCSSQGFTHNHHIFDGKANRKLSTRYGMQVYLCFDCHEKVHKDIDTMRKLQKEGQRAFESKFGSRQRFRDVFGRNYLDEYIEEDDKLEVEFRTELSDGMYGITLTATAKDGTTHGRKYFGEKDAADSMTRAELKAILLGLTKIIRPCRIKMYIHSPQTEAAVNQEWYKTWKANDWKNKKGKLVMNVDLWMRICEEIEDRHIGLSAEVAHGQKTEKRSGKEGSE